MYIQLVLRLVVQTPFVSICCGFVVQLVLQHAVRQIEVSGARLYGPVFIVSVVRQLRAELTFVQQHLTAGGGGANVMN